MPDCEGAREGLDTGRTVKQSSCFYSVIKTRARVGGNSMSCEYGRSSYVRIR